MKQKKDTNKQYLTYISEDGFPITVVCRSEESINKHIELHKLNKSKIYISKLPPVNPEVTIQSIHRTLEFVGGKENINSLWRAGVKGRSHETII